MNPVGVGTREVDVLVANMTLEAVTSDVLVVVVISVNVWVIVVISVNVWVIVVLMVSVTGVDPVMMVIMAVVVDFSVLVNRGQMNVLTGVCVVVIVVVIVGSLEVNVVV